MTVKRDRRSRQLWSASRKRHYYYYSLLTRFKIPNVQVFQELKVPDDFKNLSFVGAYIVAIFELKHWCLALRALINLLEDLCITIRTLPW